MCSVPPVLEFMCVWFPGLGSFLIPAVFNSKGMRNSENQRVYRIHEFFKTNGHTKINPTPLQPDQILRLAAGCWWWGAWAHSYETTPRRSWAHTKHDDFSPVVLALPHCSTTTFSHVELRAAAHAR